MPHVSFGDIGSTYQNPTAYIIYAKYPLLEILGTSSSVSNLGFYFGFSNICMCVNEMSWEWDPSSIKLVSCVGYVH